MLLSSRGMEKRAISGKDLRRFLSFWASVLNFQAMQGWWFSIRLIIPGQSQQIREGVQWRSKQASKARAIASNSAARGEGWTSPRDPAIKIWPLEVRIINPNPEMFVPEDQEASVKIVIDREVVRGDWLRELPVDLGRGKEKIRANRSSSGREGIKSGLQLLKNDITPFFPCEPSQRSNKSSGLSTTRSREFLESQLRPRGEESGIISNKANGMKDRDPRASHLGARPNNMISSFLFKSAKRA